MIVEPQVSKGLFGIPSVGFKTTSSSSRPIDIVSIAKSASLNINKELKVG